MNRVQIIQGVEISPQMREDVLQKAIDNILESDDFIVVTRDKNTNDFTCQSRFVSRNKVVLQVMGKILEQIKNHVKGEKDAV